MSNTAKGKYGEELASKYLLSKGYKLLERNFHFSRFGEIDIIAIKDGHISFVEVKTRKNNAFGHPLEAISKLKLGKIIMSMQHYLSITKVKYRSYGLDAIAITLDDGKIEHMQNLEV